MKRSILLLAGLMLFAATAHADPISYTITWTLTDGGPAPLTTYYTYDPETAWFENLAVDWDETNFNFQDFNYVLGFAEREQIQAELLTPNRSWTIECGGFDVNHAYDCVFTGFPYPWMITRDNRGGYGTGTFAVAMTSPQAVPEPGTLTLLGLGLVGVLTKRSRPPSPRRLSGPIPKVNPGRL